MVTFGIDAHKRTHTVVAVDDVGRPLGCKTTTATTSDDHLEMLAWAEQFDAERMWAVEDCRHLSRRLERDLLGVGEKIKRVPPKLMAHARDAARTYGKSDPIDALAVAHAALRHPELPTAQLEGPAREVRLLIDHREDLVAERTRCINRLRWHLHELDPSWDPPARCLIRYKHLDAIAARLADLEGPVVGIAQEIVTRIREITVREPDLERQITELVTELAPTLLARAGVHRIAITQMRTHDDANAYLERRNAMGNTTTEALRALKRRLFDAVYRDLLADAQPTAASCLADAA